MKQIQFFFRCPETKILRLGKAFDNEVWCGTKI